AKQVPVPGTWGGAEIPRDTFRQSKKRPFRQSSKRSYLERLNWIVLLLPAESNSGQLCYKIGTHSPERILLMLWPAKRRLHSERHTVSVRAWPETGARAPIAR